jgi:hypothetical protein
MYQYIYLKENSPELNIDASDDNERAELMWICLNLTRKHLNYSLEGIKLLLDANASPHASDKENRTPLSVSTNYDKVQEMFTSNVNTKYILKLQCKLSSIQFNHIFNIILASSDPYIQCIYRDIILKIHIYRHVQTL